MLVCTLVLSPMPLAINTLDHQFRNCKHSSLGGGRGRHLQSLVLQQLWITSLNILCILHLRFWIRANFWAPCPCSIAQKWDFKRPNPKSETTFSRQHPPKMVDLTFVLCVYHFWMRNKQILNFAYFYLIFP